MELAIEAGGSAVATTFSGLGILSRRYAHKIPMVVKLNHNELLTYPSKFDQVPFAQVRQAVDLGATGVGATVYFGSAESSRQIQVLGAWLAKEYLRDVYFTEDPGEAPVLLDRVIAGCLTDDVDEIVSSGNTLQHWRTQILAHDLTGASNGPTEAMNLLVKKIKHCGHGFKSFRHYRLRVLLHCGGIKWDAHPATTMRAHSPQLVA